MIEELMEELVTKLWNFFEIIANSFSSFIRNFFSYFWDVIRSSPFWKILNFIRDILVFLIYAVRSIINIIRNFIYVILPNVIVWVEETFYNLSLYIWKPAMYLFQLFWVILLILIFQFILRLLTWKYHYKKVSK